MLHAHEKSRQARSSARRHEESKVTPPSLSLSLSFPSPLPKSEDQHDSLAWQGDPRAGEAETLGAATEKKGGGKENFHMLLDPTLQRVIIPTFLYFLALFVNLI